MRIATAGVTKSSGSTLWSLKCPILSILRDGPTQNINPLYNPRVRAATCLLGQLRGRE